MGLPAFNHLSTQKCYFNPPYFFHKSWLTSPLHSTPLASFKLLSALSPCQNYTRVRTSVVPWHNATQKHPSVYPEHPSQGITRLRLDNRSNLRSDGMELTTSSWKIPSETRITKPKATVSALKSFLVVRSYSCTGSGQHQKWDLVIIFVLQLVMTPTKWSEFPPRHFTRGSHWHFSCILCEGCSSGLKNGLGRTATLSVFPLHSLMLSSKSGTHGQN